jgi:SAM-dependent methyltransferase
MSNGDAVTTADRAWEHEAEDWVRWVRTPGNDVFPQFAPAFFEEILPPAPGRTLEIGCGEGRVARELVAIGHGVIAVDPSPTLVRAARELDAASAYVAADGTRLPFADGAFGTVMAYNSLQAMADVADMPRAVREAGRVVGPGGYFCACVAHPMTDMALVDAASGGDGAAPYFDRRRVDTTVRKDGLTMRFHGWMYTLEDYAQALAAAGFMIERVHEPQPRGEGPRLDRWRQIPLFLMLRAVKGGA